MISLNCSHCAAPAAGAPDAFKTFCFPDKKRAKANETPRPELKKFIEWCRFPVHVFAKFWFMLHIYIVFFIQICHVPLDAVLDRPNLKSSTRLNYYQRETLFRM